MIPENEISKSGIWDFKIFPVSEKKFLTFRGDNRKGLLVVISGEENHELTAFLIKVLAAVKHDLHQDASTLHISPAQNFTFSEIARSAKLSNAVFFGLKPSQAGLNLTLRPYQPKVFGKTTFLFADDLAKIQNDAELKRQLWAALKTMFQQ